MRMCLLLTDTPTTVEQPLGIPSLWVTGAMSGLACSGCQDVLVCSWSHGWRSKLRSRLSHTDKLVSVGMTSQSPSISDSSSSVQSVEGPSGAAKAMSLRPQVVGHTSGSAGVEVVSLSSGGATPTDSKILKALMIMQSCYNSDSTMMVRQLAEVRECFCILTEYELHVPLPE
ncbi:hypothetical protein BHE74_00037530 [Ensete ventricosum]|nr:hypothetical protein BHE74_00037530 [Ensete ventricosum]